VTGKRRDFAYYVSRGRRGGRVPWLPFRRAEFLDVDIVDGPDAARKTGARQREFSPHHAAEGLSAVGVIDWALASAPRGLRFVNSEKRACFVLRGVYSAVMNNANATTPLPAATPAKLRDGSWGARCTATVAVGDLIQITTRAGKSWTAQVTRVLWAGEGVTLCATASADRPARAARTWDRDAFAGYGRSRGGYRRACVSDGNCSSIGSGRSCGGHDCDGY
jgi:hypothetical protein